MPLTRAAAWAEMEKGVRSRRELEGEQGRGKQNGVSADIGRLKDMVVLRVTCEG